MIRTIIVVAAVIVAVVEAAQAGAVFVRPTRVTVVTAVNPEAPLSLRGGGNIAEYLVVVVRVVLQWDD